MKVRLERIRDAILSKQDNLYHVIEVESYRGETDQQALERYSIKNNVRPTGQAIFIHIKSNQQIREGLQDAEG